MALPYAPRTSPVLSGIAALMQRVWLDWLAALTLAVNATTQQRQAVSLTAQAAAIATTAFRTGSPLTTGLYAVRFYLRITQAATTSSSATVTLTWVDGGVTCTQSFAAVTGNTTSTTQNGAIVVQCDAGSAVSYAVAYATVGATAMQYAIGLCLEQLP